jgi:hypothetical protein
LERSRRFRQTEAHCEYSGVNGTYYAGDEAWDYVKEYTDVDLKQILTEIVQEKLGEQK